MFDPGLLVKLAQQSVQTLSTPCPPCPHKVKLAQQIVQTATRVDAELQDGVIDKTNKRKTTQEESESGKSCKRRKCERGNKRNRIRNTKEGGSLQEEDNFKQGSAHLRKEVWVTSLTETSQSNPRELQHQE